MKAGMRRWLQPSLVRRLLLAQMATAAVLWVASVAYVLHFGSAQSSEGDLAQMRLGASLVLPLATALEREPLLLRQTLQRIDDFQRANQSALVEDAAAAGFQFARIYLWRDAQLVYRSADALGEPAIDRDGALVEVLVDGRPWRAFAEVSADGRARFAAITPASIDAAGITPWSRSWLAFPLIVSLPLLILPAWWSVRFALRPLTQLSGEIASRQAQDLSPLRFEPRHRELSPLSRGVDQWLQRMVRTRDRERSFIADAAHELRTPIAAMQVHIQALQKRERFAADAALLDGLFKSNARASHLVAQMLAMTRSEAVPAHGVSTRVDLAAVTQDAMALWQPVAQVSDVEIELEASPSAEVMGDAESLRMLIDNLIGNAIKYSPQGTCVRVRVFHEQKDVNVVVVDEGPGIAPECWARVFDRFYRVPGQVQAGSGLGLAIVKTVADRHGATVQLSDGPGTKGLQVALRIAAAA
jgi:signal transduction histidine kinase